MFKAVLPARSNWQERKGDASGAAGAPTDQSGEAMEVDESEEDQENADEQEKERMDTEEQDDADAPEEDAAAEV